MNEFVYRLFCDVAEKLSGRKVKFQLKKPFYENARGSCYVDFSGKPVIRVCPELWREDKLTFLKVFLHEVSHVKKHSSGLKPTTGDVLPVTRGKDFKGSLLDVQDSLDELQAETEALWWLETVQDEPTVTGKLFKLLKVSENVRNS